MSPSRALAAVLPCLLVVGAPAAAQDRAAFADATIQFVQASEGEFGDEGRYVLAAAEAMARALAGWDAALAAAESAMAADAAGRPPHEAARIRLAVAALELERGRFERALGQLDAATTLAPDVADAYLLKGLVFDRLGRAEAATAAYREAWRRQPENLAAAYRAGAIDELLAAGRRPESGRRLVFPTDDLIDDATAQTPLVPLARYAPGFELLRQARYDDAVAALRAAAAADPLTRAPSELAGAASALRAGDAAGAIERLTAVASASRSSAGAHRVLGLAYRASGDAARALEELATAVKLDPADERARLTTAVWLAQGGRAGDARRTLRETLERIPASSRARWQLGQLAMAAGDWAAAAEVLEPLAASRPLAGAGALYAALGRAHLARSDVAGAVRAFRAWVEAAPHSSAAHVQLGEALRASGREAEAEVERLAAELLK